QSTHRFPLRGRTKEMSTSPTERRLSLDRNERLERGAPRWRRGVCIPAGRPLLENLRFTDGAQYTLHGDVIRGQTCGVVDDAISLTVIELPGTPRVCSLVRRWHMLRRPSLPGNGMSTENLL